MSDTENNANGPEEREAAAALEQISQAISGGAASTMRDSGQLCETYQRIRPWLERVLPWIQLLPRLGKQLAEAIRFLMSVADTLCPPR